MSLVSKPTLVLHVEHAFQCHMGKNYNKRISKYMKARMSYGKSKHWIYFLMIMSKIISFLIWILKYYLLLSPFHVFTLIVVVFFSYFVAFSYLSFLLIHHVFLSTMSRGFQVLRSKSHIGEKMIMYEISSHTFGTSTFISISIMHKMKCHTLFVAKGLILLIWTQFI